MPQHQRFYQNAYKNHTRVWKIVRPELIISLPADLPADRTDRTPAAASSSLPTSSSSGVPSAVSFLIESEICVGVRNPSADQHAASVYGAGRKVLGYNSYF